MGRFLQLVSGAFYLMRTSLLGDVNNTVGTMPPKKKGGKKKKGKKKDGQLAMNVCEWFTCCHGVQEREAVSYQWMRCTREVLKKFKV